MIYVGIDPGRDGAIAALSDGGCVVFAERVPMTSGSRPEYLVSDMAQLVVRAGIEAQGLEHVRAGVEQVQPFGKAGAASMLKLGRSAGLWEGVLAGMGVRYHVVRPAEWQKDVCRGLAGKPKQKAESAAARLWPQWTTSNLRRWNKAEREGIRDALLIAEAVRRIEQGVA